MAGLRRICKQFGRLEVNGVLWVWDYALDLPRKASEMTHEELAASEKAKWTKIKEQMNTVTTE